MNDADLIARLMTLAGTIMEDTSVLAIIDDGTMSIGARTTAITVAAADIESLAHAVEIIHRRAR